MTTSTPLRRWLKREGLTITGLAEKLRVSRGRTQHWVKRASAPHGLLLLKLLKITGLRAEQVMPLQDLVDYRRQRRRLSRLRVAAQQRRTSRARKTARGK
jgi:plasmid maintenance system antidote protein VapI